MEYESSENFIQHPLIKPKKLEARLYQQFISARAVEENTLVVLPTGLGKTSIAAMVMAHRLQKFPHGKAMILAPTRPLAIQHHRFFSEVLNIEEDQIVLITGAVPPDKRVDLWTSGRVFSATPQTVENDILTGRLDLSDFVLLVFDEAHRAVGDYSYTLIARHYADKAKNPRILGLTASPGSSKEKILEIINNLHIKHVEVRSRRSPDVRRYVAELKIDWVRAPLPEDYKSILDELRSFYKDLLDKLKERGIIELGRRDYVRLKDLLRLRTETITRMEDRFAAVIVAALIKLHYFMDLLETQGPEPAKRYLEKVVKRRRRAASDRLLLEDRRVLKAWKWLASLPKGSVHPKLKELASIIDKEGIKHGKKAIIFVNYRKTAETVLEYLTEKTGVSASLFIGQSRREELKGMSQEEQKRILQDFSSGKYDLLVATSVGEEGLDIPEVDLVVFYDAVPSVIRHIQRRGRTGRGRPGKVVVLVSGKKEESFYWSTVVKERKIMKALREVSSEVKERERHPTLDKFSAEEQEKPSAERKVPEVIVRVDVRELGGEVVRRLASFNDVKISVSRLEVGDYIVSDEIAIERKTVDDLASSLVDGRIFDQMKKLKATYKRPILLIEGETPYRASKRGVNPRSLMGLVASLVTGGLPVLWAKNPEESAELIRLMAIREQTDKRVIPEIKHPPAIDERAVLERVLTGIPGVGVVIARNLLSAFGTLRRVFSASEEELQSVEGVGPQIAKRIVEFATREYGEE